MTDGTSLSVLYRDARERVTGLVRAHPEAADNPVPATPGWRVHDVIAHLTGVSEDLTSGWRPTGGPTDEWTATHIARGRDVPTEQLLERWAELGLAVERLVDAGSAWQIAIDAGAHEHDVRAALGDSGARDTELVTRGGTLLLETLQVPLPLTVRTELGRLRLGPDTDDDTITSLTTTTFEAFRWRLGRRSRRQLAAMGWSADPAPYLDHLCVFGPAESDVIE